MYGGTTLHWPFFLCLIWLNYAQLPFTRIGFWTLEVELSISIMHSHPTKENLVPLSQGHKKEPSRDLPQMALQLDRLSYHSIWHILLHPHHISLCHQPSLNHQNHHFHLNWCLSLCQISHAVTYCKVSTETWCLTRIHWMQTLLCI